MSLQTHRNIMHKRNERGNNTDYRYSRTFCGHVVDLSTCSCTLACKPTILITLEFVATGTINVFLEDSLVPVSFKPLANMSRITIKLQVIFDSL